MEEEAGEGEGEIKEGQGLRDSEGLLLISRVCKSWSWQPYLQETCMPQFPDPVGCFVHGEKSSTGSLRTHTGRADANCVVRWMPQVRELQVSFSGRIGGEMLK